MNDLWCFYDDGFGMFDYFVPFFIYKGRLCAVTTCRASTFLRKKQKYHIQGNIIYFLSIAIFPSHNFLQCFEMVFSGIFWQNRKQIFAEILSSSATQ